MWRGAGEASRRLGAGRRGGVVDVIRVVRRQSIRPDQSEVGQWVQDANIREANQAGSTYRCVAIVEIEFRRGAILNQVVNIARTIADVRDVQPCVGSAAKKQVNLAVDGVHIASQRRSAGNIDDVVKGAS